jgi:hypothetical protein
MPEHKAMFGPKCLYSIKHPASRLMRRKLSFQNGLTK